MKGMVFREFIDYLENNFGLEFVDKIITKSNLPSNAAYTNVGTYHHEEMLTLITILAKELKTDASELTRAFGKHLFGVLADSHPEMIKDYKNLVTMFAKLHSTIHEEVKKTYDNAEVPNIELNIINNNKFEITYSSLRPFADVAHGLVEGSITYFKENYQIDRQDLGKKDGTNAKFTLTR